MKAIKKEYTAEFKKNAVAMLETHTPTQVIKKFGVSESALRRWKKEAEQPEKKSGKTSPATVRYSDEVKQRALAMMRDGKHTQREVARKIGCSL